MKLKDLQDCFYAHMVNKSKLKPLTEFIIPGGKFEKPEDVMEVHTDGYYARLTEVLGEMYKAIWYVLGDEDFFRVCENYIKKNPSRTYNLTLYGTKFPDYIAQTNYAEEFDFLEDLANFELNFHELFNSKQCVPLSSDELAQRFSPTSRIEFAPNMKLLHFESAIYELWKASREESSLDLVELHTEEFLCMYKFEDQVYIKELSSDAFILLSDLKNGKSLQEALENEALENLEAEHIQKLFAWIASSSIIRYIA